jgi:cytochrome c553
VDGGGVSDGSVPAIAGQHYKVIAKQLVDFRQSQRGDVRMQHFADVTHLSYSQEVADVSAYASCLAPRRSMAAKPAVSHVAGAGLYEKSCARCHGQDAQGMDSWLVPSLAGQHAAYLTKQLQSLELRPPLRKAHAEIATPLDDKGIEQVSGYLASLVPKPAGQTKERAALCTPPRAEGRKN